MGSFNQPLTNTVYRSTGCVMNTDHNVSETCFISQTHGSKSTGTRADMLSGGYGGTATAKSGGDQGPRIYLVMQCITSN